MIKNVKFIKYDTEILDHFDNEYHRVSHDMKKMNPRIDAFVADPCDMKCKENFFMDFRKLGDDARKAKKVEDVLKGLRKECSLHEIYMPGRRFIFSVPNDGLNKNNENMHNDLKKITDRIEKSALKLPVVLIINLIPSGMIARFSITGRRYLATINGVYEIASGGYTDIDYNEALKFNKYYNMKYKNERPVSDTWSKIRKALKQMNKKKEMDTRIIINYAGRFIHKPELLFSDEDENKVLRKNLMGNYPEIYKILIYAAPFLRRYFDDVRKVMYYNSAIREIYKWKSSNPSSRLVMTTAYIQSLDRQKHVKLTAYIVSTDPNNNRFVIEHEDSRSKIVYVTSYDVHNMKRIYVDELLHDRSKTQTTFFDLEGRLYKKTMYRPEHKGDWTQQIIFDVYSGEKYVATPFIVGNVRSQNIYHYYKYADDKTLVSYRLVKIISGGEHRIVKYGICHKIAGKDHVLYDYETAQKLSKKKLTLDAYMRMYKGLIKTRRQFLEHVEGLQVYAEKSEVLRQTREYGKKLLGINKKISLIEKKYGITVDTEMRLWALNPLVFGIVKFIAKKIGYPSFNNVKLISLLALDHMLDALISVLSMYPPSLLKRYKLSRVHFLTVDNYLAIGLVVNVKNNWMFFASAGRYLSKRMLKSLIHHEFFHHFDSYLNSGLRYFIIDNPLFNPVEWGYRAHGKNYRLSYDRYGMSSSSVDMDKVDRDRFRHMPYSKKMDFLFKIYREFNKYNNEQIIKLIETINDDERVVWNIRKRQQFYTHLINLRSFPYGGNPIERYNNSLAQNRNILIDLVFVKLNRMIRGFSRIYALDPKYLKYKIFEDRATIAEELFTAESYNEITLRAKYDEVLRKKIEMIKEYYYIISNGMMDVSFWGDISKGIEINETYWKQGTKLKIRTSG